MKKLLIALLILLACISIVGCQYLPASITDKLGITDSGNGEGESQDDTADENKAENQHTHEYTATVVNPTCESEGYTLYICACGDEYTDTVTAALGHSMEEYAYTNLQHNGTEYYVDAFCSVCEMKYNEFFTEVTDFVLTEYTKGALDLSASNLFLPEVFYSEGVWYKVVGVGENAFWKNTALTSITLGKTVTSIEDGAFKSCHNLSFVNVTDSLTVIGDSAFEMCESLRGFDMPDSVTEIGDRAFYCCSALSSVTFSKNLVSIGDYAFFGCLKLSKINVPASVRTIGDSAFVNCIFSSFVGGAGLESIGNDAFYNCHKLTAVFFGGTKDEYKNIVIGDGNGKLSSIPVYYYSDTKASGCWHYDEKGNIAMW